MVTGWKYYVKINGVLVLGPYSTLIELENDLPPLRGSYTVVRINSAEKEEYYTTVKK